jgi:hypothetical protein
MDHVGPGLDFTDVPLPQLHVVRPCNPCLVLHLVFCLDVVGFTLIHMCWYGLE